MTFHDGEMTPQEIHGTQLRLATEEFESKVNAYKTDVDFNVIAAEDLLADIIAARIRLQSTRE